MADLETSEGQVLRPASFAHVFLRTNRFKEMVKWYKTVLGAEARFETERIAFLCFDEEHHRIAICAMPGTGDKIKTSSGLEHMAFGFKTLDDLALAYQQRKAVGILPCWCVNHGITMSIYYYDPDGNQIETQVDSFEDNEEATAYMLGPDFKANPVGTEFDPEDLVRRLQAGEDLASIRKRDGPPAKAPKT
ncbi:Glyoxalase/Bleomycin resistance protein/Dihydroxybiphenyl dioxygenase [Hypoxylon fuscum]|nr:Glyoxalase/Bleomycin resistance protein/Dihydroxybiphenyl dioxygenase [Hypoxylon fuscum]